MLSLVVAVVLWGSAPVAIRVALRGYPPGQLAFLRFGMASILLALYGLFAGLRLPRRADLLMLILSGAIGITFYNTVLNYGLQTVPAGAASFLVASTPIWTSLLAVVFLGERLNGLGWSGILLSFVGIGLIARERGHGLHFSPGAVLIGLNAICYAIYMILQKRLLGRYQALEFTYYSFWAGSLLMIPFGHGAWTSIQSAESQATWALIYLGVFPAAIANVAWAYTMSHIPASRVSSFLYLMPVSTVVIAWLWLGEIPTALTWTGGALALAGVSLVNVWGHQGAPEATPHEDILTPEVLE
jgi:drug/metabolite transporter (DMT)-like permease